MAKMIPERLPLEIKSSAEKKLFYKLQDMEGTDNWTVLHSVGIADHPTQSQGEADFVVIIPDEGIFVLEVKGGGISYRDGRWKSIDRDKKEHDIKDPVYEANEAMHGMLDYVKSNASSASSESRSLFGFGVVFPDSGFHGKFSIPDLGDAQIADYNDLLDMKKYLLGLSKFWRERKASFVEVPDVTTCKRIVSLLRPEFDSNIPLAHQIESVERQAVSLTERQQLIFDGLRDNERCLVRGGAGTGKTLLAIDLARDMASQGKSVAFFCYNRQLAEYLKKNTEGDSISCCGSLTDYMVQTLNQYSKEPVNFDKIDDKDLFFRETLPELFSECFVENDLQPFDYLIIDEAQDLMTEQYLDTFEFIVSGGINEGDWCMFMDADRQNVFHIGMTYEDIKDVLKNRKVFYAKFELKENCRNSVSIINELVDLFGVSIESPMVEEKGTPVVKKIYGKGANQAKLVASTIDKLLTEEKVKPEMITILSPNRFHNSVISILQDEIAVSNEHEAGKIYFSTIDSYKGLESPVVLITDISDIRWAKDISRIYILE